MSVSQEVYEGLTARIAELEDQLNAIVDESMGYGYPESTPNAAGQPVSTEPAPADLVRHALRSCQARIAELERALELCNNKRKERCLSREYDWTPEHWIAKAREGGE